MSLTLPAPPSPPSSGGPPPLLPDHPYDAMRAYLDAGGGRGLDAALQLSPDEIIDRVTASGLRGRGGAGFPTGTKWRGIVQTARDEECDVAVVVNGAEGEPGTYKDRALLLSNPYQLIEGLLIAARAVGASTTWIAVKERFVEVRDRLAQAIEEAEAAGWGGAADIRIATGPDSYLFGEETAMLEVIEGNLPMPRHLAPYMNGLFATSAHPNLALANNVETLANVPRILADGPDAFRAVGTDDTPGTLLFTISGDVETAGVHELPAGTPLRVLVEDLAGATDVQLVVSGVSNAVITPDLLDTPMDHASMKAAGTGLGSGGYVVYDSSHCIVQVAEALTRFLAVESCGQCNACKFGTGQIHEILERLITGDVDGVQLRALVTWAIRVTDQARCGLPTGAQILVTSLIETYEQHLLRHLDAPCAIGPTVPVPKIDHLDLDTGVCTYDPTYHRKQTDWTYAE